MFYNCADPSVDEYSRLLAALFSPTFGSQHFGYVDGDQDFLNWYYASRWHELPFAYNFRLRGLFSSATQLQEHMRVCVFHFAGINTKPWQRTRETELTYFALLWWLLHDVTVQQLPLSSAL